MKSYLNAEEQRKLVVMFCMLAELEKMQENWGSRDCLTEEEDASLKTAFDALQEGLGKIFNRLSPEQQRRIYRCSKENIIQMRPKLTGALARREMDREVKEEGEEGAFMPKNIIDNVADVVLYNCCHPCKLEVCDRKTCKAREVLICLDVPMFDEYAAGDRCPYDNGGE